MSGFGFSPSDVVKAAQLARKAVQALGDGHDGAQQQYQHDIAALNARHKAVTDLEASCSPAPSTGDYAKLLSLERHMREQLEPYEAALASRVKKAPWHGIKRKLQYQFDGSSRFRDHIDSTRPFVDSVLLRTLEIQNKQSGSDHGHIVSQLQSDTAILSHEIAAVHTDIRKLANDTVLNEVRDELRRVHEILVTQLSDQRAATKPYIKEGSEFNAVSSMHVDSSTVTLQTQGPRRMASSTLAIVHDNFHNFTAHLLTCLTTISAIAMYHNPRLRSSIASIIKTSWTEPTSFTLAIFAAFVLSTWLLRIPAHIALLTDNSIWLETALGQHIRISSWHWTDRDIFHGFLVAHFRGKPGQKYVKRERYRILAGSGNGNVIHFTRWEDVVPRMKLTMAFLITGHENHCPRCQEVLIEKEHGLSHCEHCKKEYQFIEGEDDSHHQTLPDHMGRSKNTPLFASTEATSLYAKDGTELGYQQEEIKFFVHMLLLQPQAANHLLEDMIQERNAHSNRHTNSPNDNSDATYRGATSEEAIQSHNRVGHSWLDLELDETAIQSSSEISPVQLHGRQSEQSTTCAVNCTSKTDEHNGSPSWNSSLSRALAEANRAVALDNAYKIGDAITAYTETSAILQQIIDRCDDEEDVKKLKNIRSVYMNRITELYGMRDLDDSKLECFQDEDSL